MFELASPLVDGSQTVEIALATDPAWHDALTDRYVEAFAAGDWSALDLEAAKRQGVDVEVVEGVPHVDGKPIDGDAVRGLATLATLAAMTRWKVAGEWPDGFEPGPVARVLVRPLTQAQRAVVEAQQGPRPIGDSKRERAWHLIGDRCRWDLQVKGVEQGGKAYDADAFVEQVAAHSQRAADALRNEITMHLRRLYLEPIRLGKGCAVRSGSPSPDRSDVRPRSA